MGNEQKSRLVSLKVEEGGDGSRLDVYLSKNLEEMSRSRLKNLIIDGVVSVNNEICTNPSGKVRADDDIRLLIDPPVDDTPEPEDIKLSVVHEDNDLLVINKQAGLVVHPGAGNRTGTLVNALLFHCGESLSGIGGVRRPGIVHRLDKDTTGLMIIAKSDAAHKGLSEQLSDRSLKRNYKAVVWRVPDLLKGRIDEPIGRHPTQRVKMAVNRKNGREAATNYELLEKYNNSLSMVECMLESGRTHQVRVHMSHIGHPLVGDPLYGIQATAAASLIKKAGYSEKEKEIITGFGRQALHAWKIEFIHPISGEQMSFSADLPDDMQGLVDALKTGD
jgi:23S rRNA pseudouridine1911/1915/1917 synthase